MALIGKFRTYFFSELYLYTIPETRVACRTMHLRMFWMATILNNAFEVRIKRITHLLIIFFIFQALQSQISQIWSKMDLSCFATKHFIKELCSIMDTICKQASITLIILRNWIHEHYANTHGTLLSTVMMIYGNYSLVKLECTFLSTRRHNSILVRTGIFGQNVYPPPLPTIARLRANIMIDIIRNAFSRRPSYTLGNHWKTSKIRES